MVRGTRLTFIPDTYMATPSSRLIALVSLDNTLHAGLLMQPAASGHTVVTGAVSTARWRLQPPFRIQEDQDETLRFPLSVR